MEYFGVFKKLLAASSLFYSTVLSGGVNDSVQMVKYVGFSPFLLHP